MFSAWAPPAANQAENTVFIWEFYQLPKNSISLEYQRLEHTGAPGTGDCRVPGTRNSGWAQIPSVIFAGLGRLLVQLVFPSGGSHPVQSPAGFDCRRFCLCQRSPPSLSPQEWELSWDIPEPSGINQCWAGKMLPAGTTFTEKRRGKKSTESVACLTKQGFQTDPQNLPKEPSQPMPGVMGQPWLQPNQPALHLFHHFLSKHCPDTGRLLQNIIKPAAAAAREWLLLAFIFPQLFSGLSFRGRPDQGVVRAVPHPRINPGRLYDSGMTHCSSSVPSRLLGVC